MFFSRWFRYKFIDKTLARCLTLNKRHLINFSDFFLTDFIIIRLSKLTACIHNANVEGHLRMSNDIQRHAAKAWLL